MIRLKDTAFFVSNRIGFKQDLSRHRFRVVGRYFSRKFCEKIFFGFHSCKLRTYIE